MKKTLLISCIALLLNCKSKSTDGFLPPAVSEVNLVIKAVIEQDSLSVGGIPLSSDLRKISVAFIPYKKNSIPPTLDFDVLKISYNLPDKLVDNITFIKSDSTYLRFQNDTLKSFKLDQSFSKLISFTTSSMIRQKTAKKGMPIFGNCYFNMTIPVFSKDHNLVYVQVTRRCNGIGGGAHEVYLHKRNGKWIVKKRRSLWIS